MSRIPFGNLPPSVANVVGSFRNSTTSDNSYTRNINTLPDLKLNEYTDIFHLVNAMHVTEFVGLARSRLELGLSRSSLHQPGILQEYCEHDENN